jgi:hypothetical protein
MLMQYHQDQIAPLGLGALLHSVDVSISSGRKRIEGAAGVYAAPVTLKLSGFFPNHRGARAEALPTKRLSL